MIKYQKVKSLSICEFLPFSLGTAVKLIWEGRTGGDFEEALTYLKKALDLNISTGVEGKAVELVSRMRGTTLSGERRLKVIQKALNLFVSDKSLTSSICQEILGLADQVGDTMVLRQEPDDLVMRPEMECRDDSDLVLRPGMDGGMMKLNTLMDNMPSEVLKEIKQDAKDFLDKHLGKEPKTEPLMDELTYEPVEDFGPRMREGELSAEDVDVFEGVQKYVPKKVQA